MNGALPCLSYGCGILAVLGSTGTLVFVLIAAVPLAFFGYLFISEAITRSRLKRTLRRAATPQGDKAEH
jgi:hypothetical protein